MKRAFVILGLAGLLALSGCIPRKPNPEFSDCANACTTRQDRCMVNASTAKEIEQCNTRFDGCMLQCEATHSRYLK